MFFGYDVTEQVGNRQKLEDAAVAKEEFLSMASHEMRTPVTSIKGYTQVLESKFMQAQDTSSALLLSKLDEQIDNLTSLITDLFDDTKVKEGKMVLHCENLDINSVVTDAITEVQYTTTDHKITSILAPHVTVYADRARLKQVFVNLLTNAVKYSPKGKKITVISNITQDFVILNVEDFGLGIPENEYALIFTRFYRIHGKKFDTFPGLGLGLYIAADIIHRHKGTIHVESAMGKGSVFSVTLPIKKKYQIK
jgi:two-component system CheB/CheR fusion protein